VLLLGIALGIVLALGGLKIGPVAVPSGSIWITILIIGGVLVPYMARPLRGSVLSLREKEFVEAAVAGGAGPLRVMFGELLPNLSSTIIVFFTLGIANAMLFEAALSFLGVGVQAPDTSWGLMVGEGFELINSAPLLTILPGTMIFLTVLSVNVFGDGLRDALDPRSKVLLEAHAGIAEPEGTPV
jgi:peptide/nickel transport system permease protein